jgi:RIO kinase 1
LTEDKLHSSIKQRNLQHHDDQGLSNKVANYLKKSEQKIDDERLRVKDKSDRATLEQCLDPRTLIILEKWKNNKRIDELHGCISAGKEANVYLSQGTLNFETMEPYPEGTPYKEYAIKVFKTSILVFKDRERYVQGEYRFRNGHCKGNPRKMVKLWAEKEVRNLKRISLVDAIKCPVPHIFKNNVILMDFIGENGCAAPRLKDASVENWQDAYEQTLLAIRRMF